jgi:threonine synthase
MNSPCFLDPRTGRTHALTDARWRSDDGGPMLVSDLPGISRDDIDTRERSLWRYRAAFPGELARPPSGGEGCTPLVQREWSPGVSASFKLEWFNPTCSFKDRGASVMLAHLKQLGITSILEDSSGNGGAAIAAAGAACGIRVKVLAPASTPAPKLAQVRAFGAEVQLVPGPREASEAEAMRQAAGTFYASHNWHPFFLQGTKTLAYELWEDLGFEAPDNVIVPAGAGSNVLGCHIGFSELLRAGQIAKVPRIFAVQPLNCSPIDAAFTDLSTWEQRPVTPTVAEGTAIRRPVRLQEVLVALRTSGGRTVAVTEEQILDAVRRLAAMGLYAEPTSAQAAAALSLLVQDGTISATGRTVVVLTGVGLKATPLMMKLFGTGDDTP